VTSLQTKAYIRGVSAAFSGKRNPMCPYDRPKLIDAFRRGYEDGRDNPDDAVIFLKQNT
jgi:ribosome modulation factor